MFSEALKAAAQYIMPVIFSQRHFNGRIVSGIASLIVVNPDGWILTAAHVGQAILQIERDRPAIEEFELNQKAILHDPGLTEKRRRKELGRLRANPDWVTHEAVMWGFLASRLEHIHLDELADLAIGRLEPFDPNWIGSYPVFKNPASPMPVGTSLCRLGFPFHEVHATFDSATGKFEYAPSTFPVPRFPNEGIHTRLVISKNPDGTREAKFIETSSPGLRGQSGGPILDREGYVWAMQCKTQSLPLGFAPVVRERGRETVEHQFMHVGWGAHVAEIIRMLTDSNVAFEISPS